MLRVFFALNLVLVSLYACKGGYKTCIAKVQDSHAIHNQLLQIPVSKTQKLIYSKVRPKAKILKHDPFLNLYLVKSYSKFKYPFSTNYKLSLGHAAVNNQRAIEGRITKEQVGLNSLANFSEVISAPSLLLSSCCALEGIVTQKGIIQKEYIDHFLKSKNLHYGDIGIRVWDVKNKTIIRRVNPFEKSLGFHVGDEVLEMDSKKVHNAAQLMRKILFSKVGSKHKLKIKRDNKTIILNAQTLKRYGGGNIGDTFLESKGLYFDQNLCITKVSEEFKKYGLKVGDKLLQVNGKKVKSIDEIRENIDDFKFYASLLFTRNHFQFFVNIN